IPLIPVGSHLVLGRTSTGAFGKAVPFRFKSVILAWARALCVVAALFFGWQATLEVMNLNAPIGPYAPQGPQVPAPAETSPAPVGVPTGPAASPSSPRKHVSDHAVHVVVAVGLCVICLFFVGLAVLFWKLKWLRRASYARAMRLCELAQLSDEARIRI